MNVSKASLNWRDAGGMLITASNNSTKQTKIMKKHFWNYMQAKLSVK